MDKKEAIHNRCKAALHQLLKACAHTVEIDDLDEDLTSEDPGVSLYFEKEVDGNDAFLYLEKTLVSEPAITHIYGNTYQYNDDRSAPYRGRVHLLYFAEHSFFLNVLIDTEVYEDEDKLTLQIDGHPVSNKAELLALQQDYFLQSTLYDYGHGLDVIASNLEEYMSIAQENFNLSPKAIIDQMLSSSKKLSALAGANQLYSPKATSKDELIKAFEAKFKAYQLGYQASSELKQLTIQWQLDGNRLNYCIDNGIHCWHRGVDTEQAHWFLDRKDPLYVKAGAKTLSVDSEEISLLSYAVALRDLTGETVVSIEIDNPEYQADEKQVNTIQIKKMP